ncbi:hypothetical protein SEA_SUERTE_30 [Gordonia phage Suerte]|uniref:DUF3800 domain-containing protein n=1 Tax=Gordonia phage Suerte TaxID=2652883 RepID=A0A5P8DF01_9CAUD|nr:hypothetical protein PP511_gp30 [Gordonia phage Suerte]QFP97002.1 hypothetical protein SEA_SUERTE_30 [Gordonia phage Suerte]
MSRTTQPPVAVPASYPCSTFFVDESAAKASGGSYFVVGAIKTRQPGKLLRSLRQVRDETEYDSEFKFSCITRGKLTTYFKLIDALHASDAHLVATVVDRGLSDPFHKNEAEWTTHARLTAKLLVGCLNARELGTALLDSRSTPVGVSFGDTVRSMANHRLGSLGLVSVMCADSRANDGLQLADLVAGAVNHQRRGSPNAKLSHKGRVAARLAEAFAVPSFREDYRDGRVNVMTLGATEKSSRPGNMHVVPSIVQPTA